MPGKEITLGEYQQMIQKDKCWCGYEGLSLLPVEIYDHKDGWKVAGYEKRQWLWVTCPNCKYEWALWKLGVPRRQGG